MHFYKILCCRDVERLVADDRRNRHKAVKLRSSMAPPVLQYDSLAIAHSTQVKVSVDVHFG